MHRWCQSRPARNVVSFLLHFALGVLDSLHLMSVDSMCKEEMFDLLRDLPSQSRYLTRQEYRERRTCMGDKKVPHS